MPGNFSMQRSEIPLSLKSRGTYVLFLYLKKSQRVRVGSLGEIFFKKGYYLYVGSAMNGFYGRIKRYLHGGGKKHWHIDYLLEIAELKGILLIPSDERLEEYVARRLSVHFEGIKGFGSTDTRLPSHLFHVGSFKAPCDDQKIPFDRDRK